MKLLWKLNMNFGSLLSKRESFISFMSSKGRILLIVFILLTKYPAIFILKCYYFFMFSVTFFLRFIFTIFHFNIFFLSTQNISLHFRLLFSSFCRHVSILSFSSPLQLFSWNIILRIFFFILFSFYFNFLKSSNSFSISFFRYSLQIFLNICFSSFEFIVLLSLLYFCQF